MLLSPVPESGSKLGRPNFTFSPEPVTAPALAPTLSFDDNHIRVAVRCPPQDNLAHFRSRVIFYVLPALLQCRVRPPNSREAASSIDSAEVGHEQI